MHPMLTIAIRAARRAGNLIATNYESLGGIKSTQKKISDFTTIADRDAERLIIEVIKRSYPKDTIFTQKSGELIGENSDIQWVIHPLDSTLNFIKGLPHFSVSIAVRIRGRTEVAALYDPMRNELFTASRGRGAQLNGYRLRCNYTKDLEGAILATGSPFKHQKKFDAYLKIISALFTQCADFRHSGSTELDLAYVAAGRIDGFLKIGLRPWDFIAGEFLVRESGGLTTDFSGGHNYFFSGNVVSGNPRMVRAMLSLLREQLSTELKF